MKIASKDNEISSLDKDIDNLRSLILSEKQEKEQIYQQLTKLNSDLKEELELEKKSTKVNTEMDNKYKKLIADNESLNVRVIEKEKILVEHAKKIESANQRVVMYKQTLKQIFLIFLDEDMFIDLIEKCFKNSDIDNNSNGDKFFDEVYKLSSYIAPKFSLTVYGSLLNSEVLNKISKYNLETDVNYIYDSKQADF